MQKQGVRRDLSMDVRKSDAGVTHGDRFCHGQSLWEYCLPKHALIESIKDKGTSMGTVFLKNFIRGG